MRSREELLEEIRQSQEVLRKCAKEGTEELAELKGRDLMPIITSSLATIEVLRWVLEIGGKGRVGVAEFHEKLLNTLWKEGKEEERALLELNQEADIGRYDPLDETPTGEEENGV